MTKPRRRRLRWATLMVYALVASCSWTAQAQAEPPRATDASAAVRAAPAGPTVTAADSGGDPEAFRYTVVVDAPADLRALVSATVGLIRWQSFEDMTSPLFDRLAREAIGDSNNAAASLGWFSAHTDINVDTSTIPAKVTLRIATGEPTRIHAVDVQVSGPAASDTPLGTDAIALLRDDWLLPAGDVFAQRRWDEAKARAVAILAGAGYPATQVTSSEAAIDPATREGELSMTLASGPLFHFGDLVIEGLKKYPPSLVRNFSTIEPGQRYDARTLEQMVRRLNASGYFSSVHATIDAKPENAAAAPVAVAVIEAPTRHVEFGIGYSTDTAFRANANYRDVNIDDHGLQFSADLRLEQKLQSASLRLVQPPDDKHWINSASVEIERTNIENLITQTAKLGVRRQTVDERDHWDYGAAMYFDNQDPQGAESTSSHALYVDVQRIWRRTDDLIAPTRGYNVAVQVGAGVPGVSTRAFGRSIVQWAGWYPISRQWELTGRAEAGAVFASSRDGIPSALLFRTGGDNTVRGYAYQSLGVQNGNAIVPGRYYTVTSGEVTRWFSEAWGIAAFVDAGNAVDEMRDLSHLALGYGVGARLRTPLGPFRLDVAYGQDVHQVRLHLSVGLSF